jgi:S1-C subfamily serine protease
MLSPSQCDGAYRRKGSTERTDTHRCHRRRPRRWVALGAGVGAGTYAVLSENKLSIASIYDRTHEGVVEITTTMTTRPPFAQEQQQAQGSGWVYDSQGHVVTNQHVVADADTLSVRFWSGAVYPATVVGSDSSTDLAVVKVDAPSSLLHPLRSGTPTPFTSATSSSRSAAPSGSRRQ